MRLVYWFTSLGNAPHPVKCDLTVPTISTIANGFETEGFHYLWKVLTERGIIDEVLVVVESARSPGIRKWSGKYQLLVIPHIDQIEPFLRPDDIIFARGGFRSWFPILGRMNESKRWVLFYRAASNRLKWTFWDVVIEDLTDKSFVWGDRLHYRFNKPIHPDIFTFKGKTIRDIDVMFHASHIHDKKGQWKCVDAAIAYRAKYGKHIIAAMPGGFYGGLKTREAFEKVTKHKLPIWQPGMIPRVDLCKWMNRSKIYIHLGGAGQNDRGNLESLLCGCKQIIGNPQFHPPFVYENEQISKVVTDHSPEAVAAEIYSMLNEWRRTDPETVTRYYHQQNGIDVSVSQMERIIELIKRNPIPNRSVAIRELL